jgi:predicted TIM-barrel fold metal-dependent hydrolase
LTTIETTTTPGDLEPPRPEIDDFDINDLLLPDPEPQPTRYTLISVDDHVVEPPHTFEGRLPMKLQAGAPRVVESTHGRQAWLFDGRLRYEWGDSALSGRDKRLGMKTPFRYEYLRPGAYEVDARIRDMDLNNTWASVNFPSFVAGFSGRIFSQCSDQELALACTRAWNDWYYEEWYSAHPDRLIPLGLTLLTDPVAGAAEIRRNAARGFKAVSIPERPHRIGLPSIFTGHWDPILEACVETETVVCLHVASSGLQDAPPDLSTTAPRYIALIDTLFGSLSLQSCAEWIASGIPARYPDLKIVMSEGGIGWVAMLIDRLDDLIDHSPYPDTFGFDERPADVLRRNFWFCSLNDPSTITTTDVIGLENIMLEVDYPHGDSTWPNTQAIIDQNWGHLSAEDLRAICCGNAARVFGHPLPSTVLP